MISLGSAEAYVGWGGKLNGRLMASCVGNTRTKNYQNPVLAFKVTVENVEGPSFFETQCIMVIDRIRQVTETSINDHELEISSNRNAE